MDTLLTHFRTALTRAVRVAFQSQVPDEEVVADVAPCQQEGHGHYQCNSALRLAKVLKMAPRAVAQQMVDGIEPALKAECAKIEIAGPGFINFTLKSETLSRQLQEQFNDPLLGAEKPIRLEKVIVEFSSPNIAKELHVGHLRSTIIGESLARLFEFLGHEVLRLNHVGDWGTQFGMLIAYMKERAPEVLNGQVETNLQTLMGWYREAKVRFDADPEFKKRSQQEVVRLQSGDKTARAAWEMICAVSRQGFQEIYDLLGVRIHERGESFYNPMLPAVVGEFEEKGLVTLSEGAKCVFLEGFVNREGEPLPLMIQKSDGGYNYDTTDLAALRYRIFHDKASRIIVVVDAGQSLHFQLIFAAAEKIGWLDRSKTRVDHVGFGLVLGADGKKFKTRSGDTEKLIDLLYEAIERARAVLEEKSPELADDEKARLARVIGIGAVKYADLSTHRTKDYTFSYERMLRFEGNTAVFLLYAYVRIQGIKRKVGGGEVASASALHLVHPSEIALGLHLRRFGEVLQLVSADLLPNRLTEYLYELAEKFNAFFRDCRVEGSPEEKSRLALCELSARVLKQGLYLLGLETVDRM
jgi:arginyl-tRNA synthetase